jgi:DNA-binding transcriptional MocR family regulator
VREISADLRQRILAGEFPIGSALPTINELQTHYSVPSLNTIRQAQTPLVDEGLLERRPGVGVYVSSTTPRPPAARTSLQNSAWPWPLSTARSRDRPARTGRRPVTASQHSVSPSHTSDVRRLRIQLATLLAAVGYGRSKWSKTASYHYRLHRSLPAQRDLLIRRRYG